MSEFDQRSPPAQESRWLLLLRLRWPLGGAIALAFAVGQIAETLLLDERRPALRLLLDVVAWGLLGGLAVWISLTWASRLERRYQASLERALSEQRELNRRLQRANSQLELLSAVNRQIADSATLDEILDAALSFPLRLVEARAAALLLTDGGLPILARAAGAGADDLASLRAAHGLAAPEHDRRAPLLRRTPGGAALVLPLHDGTAAVGWIELYLPGDPALPDDELALLETIGSEVAEAIVSARRRAQAERAAHELDRAIAEERARIARDIHDGLAQTLAFRRMRVDLWLDWIESDPARLREELKGLKTTLREQIAELRRAIFALRPVQFDELGFAGGLNRYVVEFAGQQGWEARVDLGRMPSALPPELEGICFRVVQEGLNNAAKHAAASRVEVRVDQVDQGVRVIVRDDGRGFEPGLLADAHDRVGLRQMRERLTAIRGQLTILSRPGAGTELRAWLPISAGQGARG